MDSIAGIRRRVSEQAQQELNRLRASSTSSQATAADRAIKHTSASQAQHDAIPVFVILGSIYAKLEPFADTLADTVHSIWNFLQPYHPQDLAFALYGFFLVFFGGVFMTLVASLEAAHQFGWDRIKPAFSALYVEWTNARAAFERDNKIDANFDGVADVEQLDTRNLAARRLMVLTKAIHPENVSIALEGLTIATVAILATLRVRFAKAITLGTAIGEVLNKIFSPFTTDLLVYALPDDYEKWIPVINKYGFRYVGMTASWVLLRMVTSVFAAMRGSSIFITGMCGYLVRHKYVNGNILNEGNKIVVGVWATLAAAGVYVQVSSRFRLGFPLNLILLPLTIAEQLVVFAVGTSAK